MGVTLRFGHGMNFVGLEEIKKMVGFGLRPGEDEREYMEYVLDHWYTFGRTDDISVIETEVDGNPWFVRSRDGLDLNADIFIHNRRHLVESQWSYGGYRSFREMLLGIVSLALDSRADIFGDTPEPDDLSSSPRLGGVLGDNIALRPNFRAPNEIRNIFRSFAADHSFKEDYLEEYGLTLADKDLDPYEILPFADLFNFGDDRGLIGPVGIERLNLSIDWMESVKIETTNDLGNAVQMSGMDLVLSGGKTLRTFNDDIEDIFKGLRAIRNKPGAYVFLG